MNTDYRAAWLRAEEDIRKLEADRDLYRERSEHDRLAADHADRYREALETIANANAHFSEFARAALATPDTPPDAPTDQGPGRVCVHGYRFLADCPRCRHTTNTRGSVRGAPTEGGDVT